MRVKNGIFNMLCARVNLEQRGGREKGQVQQELGHKRKNQRRIHGLNPFGRGIRGRSLEENLVTLLRKLWKKHLKGTGSKDAEWVRKGDH